MNQTCDIRLLAFVLSITLVASCARQTPDSQSEPVKPIEPFKGGEMYTTKADGSILFEREELGTEVPSGKESKEVTVHTGDKHQIVDGFGAAMTGASCFNLLQMSSEKRRAFLKEVYDPVDGLGSSLIRVSIGASDFSVISEFTYCDKVGIENFAVPKEDIDYLIPVLKEVYEINPDVKIIASPWSAPRWMKTENTWTKSSLNAKYYADYALYFVKWIKTMEEQGFNIHAITIQNEPLNKGNSMSMYMTWEQQRDFIKKALGKAFAENKVFTKILVFDHNYNYDNIDSQKNYPLRIFADSEASKYIAGSAWHNYSGTVSELQNIVNAAPDKEIYFTEASIGEWNHGQANGFANCLMGDFESIFMGTMSYGGKGVTLWNFLLDTSNGPHRGTGACTTCYGIATMDRYTHEIVKRNSQYYNIAHASKVIKPGAVRVGIGGYSPVNTGYQAFVNPDGTIAVIVINKSTITQEFVFKNEKKVYVKVPARSIVSVRWSE